jgi:hypothetical protein
MEIEIKNPIPLSSRNGVQILHAILSLRARILESKFLNGYYQN